jgi:hypothetical protein
MTHEDTYFLFVLVFHDLRARILGLSLLRVSEPKPTTAFIGVWRQQPFLLVDRVLLYGVLQK